MASPSPPQFREIIYEDRAESAVTWLSKRYPRLDDLLSGWEFRLSRAPDLHAAPWPGTNPPLYLIKTPRWADLPQLTFFYRFDAHTVTVVAIRAVDPVLPGEI